MSIWRIRGGKPLCGTVRTQGSKNAALPIIAASCLCGCETELLNCPDLSDISAAVDILRHLGCSVSRDDDVLSIDSRALCRCDIPECLMQEMRASILFLGALLARNGCAEICAPGGCRIGKRPIDIHLDGLRALGAEISYDSERFVCKAAELRGAEINLLFPSVGATENLMLAACGAKGKTVINNAAREPEITELANFLVCLGAKITGAGTGRIVIDGFYPAQRVGWRIAPDRVVAATQLCAAAASGGAVEIRDARAWELAAVLDTLESCGCRITAKNRTITLKAPKKLDACGLVATRPFPGFPTDAQPLVMAASLRSLGSTVFVENIFENRYMHAHEMKKLGAKIQTEGRVALVTGVDVLHGAELRATDLRGGAALIIASLMAEGESFIADDGEFISRGYEDIHRLFSERGADITPVY